MEELSSNTNLATFFVTVAGGLAVSFVNFIATKIYNHYTDSNRNFFWRPKESPLKKLIDKKSFKNLKSRIKILLIDDEKSLNIEQFNEEGYSMEYWEKVKSIDPLLRGEYDIIILDIKNIASDLSPEDGFGVLKSIKDNNPLQIVIAFSAYSYDFSKKKFWDLADEAVDKPVGFLEMKEVLDNLIHRRFNPSSDLRRIEAKFRKLNINKKDIYDIEKSINKKVQKKNIIDLDEEIKLISNPVDRNQIKNMLRRFLSLFTSYEA